MSPIGREEWQRASAILDAALDTPPEERDALLDSACGDDRALRVRIEELLAACAEVAPALERPAAVAAAGVLSAGEGVAADPLEGSRLGPYRIVRAIGEGGMGTVYLAERADDQFRKQVAIKVIRSGLGSEAVRRRFRNERQILASLEHPGIARLLDGGVTDSGIPYLVMEYVEGERLDHYCDRKRLSIPERLRLFCSVCAAVEYAHENLVVHRDLKPSNVLVTPGSTGSDAEGRVRLLDFGIAKLLDDGTGSEVPHTRTGAHLMTPEYASPEQVRGEPVTPASDVYALGVVLYELLTGRRPYRLDARSPAEVEKAVAEVDPPSPSTILARAAEGDAADAAHLSRLRGVTVERHRRLLRGDLDAIVMMALRKEPDRRYATARQLRADVERHLTGAAVSARAGARGYRAARVLRRNRAKLAGAAAIVLLGAGSNALYGAYGERARVRGLIAEGGERVVLGAFSSVGGDSLLAGAVGEALRIDLGQSTAFRVLEPARVAAVLRRMERPPTTPLDEALAHEVALREGVRAVIVGDVARAGTGYLLSARILEVESGEVLGVAREAARDSSDVIDAIDRMSHALRRRLGESMARARATQPLDRVTTRSLEALQLLTQANRAMQLAGDYPTAIELLEQAIAIDSSFASAYQNLSVALANTRSRPARRVEAARRAFELSERMPERERHATRGAYYRMVGDLEGALGEYRAALETLRPDDRLRANLLINIGLVHAERREYDEAESSYRAAIAQDSLATNVSYMNLQRALIASGRLTEAGQVIERMERLFPGTPIARIARASYTGVQGDLAGAEREARGLLDAVGASPVWGIPGSRMLAHVLALQGRLAEAEDLMLGAIGRAAATGDAGSHIAATLDLAALELLLRHDTVGARSRAEAVASRYPIGEMPVAGRPYLPFALFFALSGDAARARSLFAEYEATEPDELQRGAHRFVNWVRGVIELAEGRPEDAVQSLRAADTGGCTTCVLPFLGEALEHAGRGDEARATWERYLSITWPDRAAPWPASTWDGTGDAFWRVRALERLAALEARAGLDDAASRRIDEIEKLWAEADAQLTRRVAALRVQFPAVAPAR